MHFCAVAALSACATTVATPMDSEPVTDDYAMAETVADNGDRLAIAVRAFERDSRVMICAAAGAEGDVFFSSHFPEAMLKATTVYIGNDKIMSRLEFGATYQSDVDLLGRAADCALTDKPWLASYDVAGFRFKVGRVVIST